MLVAYSSEEQRNAPLAGAGSPTKHQKISTMVDRGAPLAHCRVTSPRDGGQRRDTDTHWHRPFYYV